MEVKHQDEVETRTFGLRDHIFRVIYKAKSGIHVSCSLCRFFKYKRIQCPLALQEEELLLLCNSEQRLKILILLYRSPFSSNLIYVTYLGNTFQVPACSSSSDINSFELRGHLEFPHNFSKTSYELRTIRSLCREVLNMKMISARGSVTKNAPVAALVQVVAPATSRCHKLLPTIGFSGGCGFRRCSLPYPCFKPNRVRFFSVVASHLQSSFSNTAAERPVEGSSATTTVPASSDNEGMACSTKGENLEETNSNSTSTSPTVVPSVGTTEDVGAVFGSTTAVSTTNEPAAAGARPSGSVPKKMTGTVKFSAHGFGYIAVDGETNRQGDPLEIRFNKNQCVERLPKKGDKVEFEMETLAASGNTVARKVVGGTGPEKGKAKAAKLLATAAAGAGVNEKQPLPMDLFSSNVAANESSSVASMNEVRHMFSSLVSLISAQQAQLAQMQDEIAKLGGRRGAAIAVGKK
ncbi:unnamed protein product [Amoebophrya sp. A120]|nr:unnamed protein product [Amoebophrya sp. A120]|eukprot:GSA120T00022011001.1